MTENEVATVTATTETNLRHGDLGVEMDSVKGDVAETENSNAGDKASSEWEEECRREPTNSGADRC